MSDLLLLATEGGGGGGGTSGATIAVIILVVALGAFAVAYFVVGPGRSPGPRRRGDIPLSMRPYHSDDELETTGLTRAMSWGVAMAGFMAVFLPLYWVVEPDRINAKVDEFYEQDRDFGRELFADNCTTCHGTDASGGAASHPDPEVDAPWPAPALDNIAARYEDSEIVPDIEDFMYQTIARGRPGTPMPAWSTEHGGPMNDFQIEAIITYLLSIQTGEVEEAQAFVGASGEDVFQSNCARCHGQDAEGYVGPSLTNVLERYGADLSDPDSASYREAVEAIRSTVVNGRYVPGVAPMPPFGDRLTDGAIDRVIGYLESIQVTGGPEFGQVGGPPGGDDE